MMKPRHLFQLFVRATKAWSEDYAPSMGAAISYYTVFSLAPVLVIVIAVAGAVFGREAVQGRIVAQLGGMVGDQGAALVQNLVAASSNTDQGLVAGIISFFVLILGATSVFAELQNALDRIWHIPPAQKPKGVRAILRARLLSFGLILGMVFLLMVSLVVSTAVAAIGEFTGTLMPGAEALLQVLNIAVSMGISTLLFAMIYKLLPNTRIAWGDVIVGAFATAVLFEVGKFLIGLYLGKSSMTQTFAAAGSLVILIAWVYYAAQVFLLGAEFTKVYAQDHGSHAAARAMAGTRVTAESGVPAETRPEAQGASAPAPQDAAPRPKSRKKAHAKAELAAAARLDDNRRKLQQARPALGPRGHQGAKAGVSALAGMAAVALLRRFAHRKRGTAG